MKNCLDVFDRVYLINLERRKDRLTNFLNKNDFIVSGLQNFEVFKAIDGHELVDDKWEASKGALGCMESHLMVLKDALDKKYSNILILEDDFEFNQDFDSVFQQGWNSLPKDWDMLYLFAHDFFPSVAYNVYLMKSKSTLSTVAYAVTLPIVPTLIHLLEKRIEPVDVLYAHLHYLLNAFQFKENIGLHRAGDSDVAEIFTEAEEGTTTLQKIISKFRDLNSLPFNLKK